MIEMNVPGWGICRIENLVLDVNGTIALDGKLIDGVRERIQRLQDRLKVWLVTANTHKRQAEINYALGIQAQIIQPGDEISQKKEFVEGLRANSVIAIGQGANDCEMLQTAAIGICVLSAEGTSIKTMNASDLILPDILTALDVIENPLRLVASLRR